jgi:hypothetical protein
MMELNAKLDAATKMVKEMTKVEAEAAKVHAAMLKAEKSTGVFNGALQKVRGAFTQVGASALGQFAAMASFEGFKHLVGGLVDLGKEALQAAGEAQRTRYSFQLLMGVEPGNRLIGFLDDLAGKTEFTDGALKGFAANLLRAGFSGEKLERALAATIDLAAMAPDKMAGAAEAVGLLSKVSLKGGVSERELVSAGISPLKFFAQVAAQTGIGIGNVEKAIGAGKVRTDVLLESLYTEIVKKTGKQALGAAGVGMSKTFLAQMEKTKDIIPNLFEELENSGGLEKLTGGLDRLVQGLAPDSPAGKKIVGGLTAMLDRFGDLVTKVDFEVWSKRLVSAMELFTGLVEIGAAVAGEIGMLFDKFTGFGEALGETLFETTEMVGEFFDAAGKLGTAVWEGMQDGIVKGITWVVDSAKQLGNEAIGALKGVLGISSPSKVFANFGLMTGEGFELGVMRALPGVTRTVADAFSPDSLMPPLHDAPLPSLVGAAASAAVTMPTSAPVAGPHFEAHITVNVGGAGLADEGRAKEVADQAAFSVRAALEAAFEQWAAEGAAT